MAWSKVDFLESGESYYRALLAEIAGARASVLIEKYIFRADRTGREILAALVAARARGVRVHLRVDGVGSRQDLPALAEICANHGLEFEVYHPLPFSGTHRAFGASRADSFLARWRMLNHRNHRKLVLVDTRVAFVGGRNVDDVENELYSGATAWHDLSLRLEGSALPLLEQVYWFKPFRAPPSWDFLPNYPRLLRRARNHWFARRLQSARERFWVVTPYFAPTPAILLHLRQAAKRGVDIRLVLPNQIDVPLSRMAARALYRQLLHWGIKIYEFQPSILHRKLWVVDQAALVGSGNLNHRSFFHDLELDIVLRTAEPVAEATAAFRRDEAASTEIALGALAQLPWWKRVVYYLASWLVYWL